MKDRRTAKVRLAIERLKRQFHCECGKTYTSEGQRNRHWFRTRCAINHVKPMQPKPRVDLGVKVPCLQCGDTFPNAIDMGIHQTIEHFGQAYETERRGPMWVN